MSSVNAPAEFHRQLPSVLPRLSRFGLALTRTRSAADDLVQAACERALSRIDQWNPASRLDSWMYRIMQTMWWNEVRAKKVRDRYHDSEEAEQLGIQHEDPERRLFLIQAEQQILELPDDLRDVLILVCVEGFSYREAAEALDIPAGTVMSRLARARLLLAERLGEERLEHFVDQT
jgi:RNA polymerase sigma-70 factor, ECF subfamily